MAQTAANVSAASPLVAGGVYAGVKGTALPTDTSTALNAALKALGYIGEDGVQPSGDAPSVDPQKAWGGDTVANLITDKGTRKFTFTLLEVFNADVAKFVFGTANVTVTAAVPGTSGTKLAITDNLYIPSNQVMVWDWMYQGKRGRYVAPLASAVVTGESPLTSSGLTGYEVEATCLPDASGNSMYRYYLNDDL